MKNIQESNCQLLMIQCFGGIIKEYKKISIKYEYNQQRRRLLVSYFPKDYIFSNDNLLRKINRIEDKLKFKFVNYPLFCYEEDLFKLTDNAKELNYENIQTADIESRD